MLQYLLIIKSLIFFFTCIVFVFFVLIFIITLIFFRVIFIITLFFLITIFLCFLLIFFFIIVLFKILLTLFVSIFYFQSIIKLSIFIVGLVYSQPWLPNYFCNCKHSKKIKSHLHMHVEVKSTVDESPGRFDKRRLIHLPNNLFAFVEIWLNSICGINRFNTSGREFFYIIEEQLGNWHFLNLLFLN